jgi:hypothetical protein
MALNINGTTGISGVDGSVSAPALTGTDSNTGITFPAADTIKFSTGGVERMAITNSGITGISGGKIGQVLSTAKTDTFSRNSSSFGDITGISVDITPAATTSKVLVLVDLKVGCEHGDGDFHFRLVRGSTVIYARTTVDNRKNGFAGLSKFALDNANGEATMKVVNAIFLDSPSTTSATTYKVQVANVSGRLVYINRQGLDSNAVNIPRGASSITVMEVLA